MRRTKNRIWSSLLAIFVLASTIFITPNMSIVEAADTTEIAGWTFSEAVSFPMNATSGEDVSATLDTTADGGETTGFTAGDGSIYYTGWQQGSYWEWTINTTGYEDITFSTKTRSSGTGPKDWALSYSIDNGTTWSDVEGSQIENANALQQSYNNFVLPTNLDNQTSIKIRLSVVSDVAVNGGAISAAGTSRLAAVSFKGTAVGTITPPIDPTPGTDITDPIDDTMIPSGVITITEANEMVDGQAVSVIGQLTYAFGSSAAASTPNTYFMQDVIDGEVVGIQIYGNIPTANIGDIVTITGNMSTFNGVRQIGNPSLTNLNYDVDNFPAQEVTITELQTNYDDYVSEYVVVKGVTLGVQEVTGSNLGSTTVMQGSATLAIYRGAYYPEGIMAGDVVDVYAGMSKYNTTPQFRVGASTDYVKAGETTIDETKEIPLATWTGTMQPTTPIVYGDQEGANDYLDTDVELTHSKGDIPKASTVQAIGHASMKIGDYFQMKLDSVACGNITLSYKMRASNKAPKDFQVLYSTDGVNFEVASDTFLSMSQGGSTYEDFGIQLPEGANNADSLYIRLQVATEMNADGTTPNGTGNCYLQEISIVGNPLVSNTIVQIPEVTPNSGETLLNQELTMSCATDGATIKYSLDEGTTWNTYDAMNKPKITSLPTTLMVYGVKEGLTDSLSYTYTYTQAQVSSVKASPNGGAVVLGSTVTLTTDTAEAEIMYSMDNGVTWLTYDATDKIVLDTLPISIMVKASAEGYLDSSQTTLSFTQRENENYNTYFGQLHAHTDFSDGSGTIDQAYQHASQADQIDFLAITDHSNSFDNTNSATLSDGSMSNEWVEGQQKAEAYTTDTFVGLFGYEMTWSNGLGHMNTFNTNGFQSRTQAQFGTYSTALQNYYSALKTDTGSLSQFNHPGTTFGDFSDFAHYDEAIDALVPLIEVGNGEGAIGSSGYFPSYKYYDRALDKGWHVAPVNNQDNHKGNWGDSNTARTVVLADTLTEENIYDAIRNRRVYSTEDNDLEINYTLDGNIMGSILPEGSISENAEIKVDVKDPTDAAIGKVQIIVNGGIVLDEKNVTETDTTVTFEITPDYSYYYIRIIQNDGNIAVTAPVWVGEVEAVGISSINTTTSLPIVNEALDVNLEIFNNESEALEVDEIFFTVNDEIIHTVDLVNAGLSQIDAMSIQNYSFDYTNTEPGSVSIYVTMKGTIGGVEKVYTNVLQLDYVIPEMVSNILIDGTHYNDYVTGYYAGNMGEFSEIAARNNSQVTVATEEITAEMLADCDLFVISAPAKKAGTTDAGAYTASSFDATFIQLVKEYVQQGGTVILCGLADYQDTADYQTSTEINKLLSAIGATSRINSDETWDDENNGGQEYRLYATDHSDSIYTEGVLDTQTYSAYSGSTVVLDETALTAGKVEYLVKGHATTYSVDSKNYDSNYTEIEKGNAILLAHETLDNGANVFISGTVFMSDFELAAELDSTSNEVYSNQPIIENILQSVAVEIETSTIEEARQGELGDVFAIEGWVTAGTAIAGNTFFDTIYVQDETGGITIFPYSAEGLEIGTKIRIVGSLDAYQGDLELQIMEYEILDDENLNVIAPAEVSAEEAMNYDEVGGSLLKVSGEVTEVTMNGDVVSQFRVKDENGDIATVFIDGYITSGTTKTNDLANIIKVGAMVEATGLSYLHPEGDTTESVPCLRVRNVDEVILVKESELPELIITGVPEGTILVGDSFTLTASVPGGTWEYDENLFEVVTMDGTSITLVALKEGKSTIGYVLPDEGAVQVTITIVNGNVDITPNPPSVDEPTPSATPTGDATGYMVHVMFMVISMGVLYTIIVKKKVKDI